MYNIYVYIFLYFLVSTTVCCNFRTTSACRTHPNVLNNWVYNNGK